MRISNEQRGGPVVPDNEFAIAGFYEDGEPGVATVMMGKNGSSATFMRPQPDAELACVVIGESSVKDLVYATYLEAARRRGDFQQLVASTLWYLICAESVTMRGIGGGLAVRVCLQDPEFRTMWPLVEIDGTRFYRGVPVAPSDIHPERTSSILKLAVDINEAARLDQLIEELKVSTPRTDRGAGAVEQATHSGRFECDLETLFEVSPFHYAPEPAALRG